MFYLIKTTDGLFDKDMLSLTWREIVWHPIRYKWKRKQTWNLFSNKSIYHLIPTSFPLLYASALVYIHPAIVAVLAETWVILFVFILSKRGEDNNNWSVHSNFFLFATIGWIGVVLVILSNSSSGEDGLPSIASWGYLAGLAFVGAYVMLYTQTANRFRAIVSMVTKYSLQNKVATKQNVADPQSITISNFMVLFQTYIRAAIGLLLLIAIIVRLALFGGSNYGLSLQGSILCFSCALILTTSSERLYNLGVMGLKNLRLQSILYFTPILGLIFLFLAKPLGGLFGLGHEDLPDWGSINWGLFTAGFILVIGMNIIINVKKSEI